MAHGLLNKQMNRRNLDLQITEDCRRIDETMACRQNLQMNRQIDRCCQMQLNKQTTRMNLDLQNTATEEQPKLARDLQANPADEEIDHSLRATEQTCR